MIVAHTLHHRSWKKEILKYSIQLNTECIILGFFCQANILIYHKILKLDSDPESSSTPVSMTTDLKYISSNMIRGDGTNSLFPLSDKTRGLLCLYMSHWLFPTAPDTTVRVSLPP